MDHAIRLWDVATQRPLHEFATEPGGSVSVQMVGDGERLAMQHSFAAMLSLPGQEARFPSFATVSRQVSWRHGRTIPLPFLDAATQKTASYLPDGERLLVSGVDGLLRILDANTGEELRCFGRRGPDFAVCPVSVSPDGRTAVVRSWEPMTDNGSVRPHLYLWDLAGGMLLTELPNSGRDWTISPKGDVLATVLYADHAVGFVDARTGQRLAIGASEPAHGSFTTFSPDGSLLAVGGEFVTFEKEELHYEAPALTVWELTTWRKVAELPNHSAEVCCCFSPDGALLASGCKDGTVRLLDVGSAKELRSLRGHRAEINSLAFTADGKALISASDDGTALVWDVTAYRPTRPETLTPKQLEVLWSDLASADAATAYRASVRLVRCGPAAVNFLKTRLRPLTPPDADRVNGLLADLDDNDFTVRERATKELTALEHTAVPSLKKALEGKRSPEVRRRVERACWATWTIPRRRRSGCATCAGGVGATRLTASRGGTRNDTADELRAHHGQEAKAR